jgi:hypothetical protein
MIKRKSKDSIPCFLRSNINQWQPIIYSEAKIQKRKEINYAK